MPKVNYLHSNKRSLLVRGLWAGAWVGLFGLVGCDPSAVSAEHKRLKPENFSKIRTGMMELEVLNILGEPHQKVTSPTNATQLNYLWRWKNEADEAMTFTVFFDSNKLVLRSDNARDEQKPGH